MKNIFKISLLLLLSLSAIKAEEVLFDLLAQDFEQPEKKCDDSRYRVSKNVTIDMNMFEENGNYVNCDGKSGYINIALHKTIANFTFLTNFTIEHSIRRSGAVEYTDDNPVDRSIKFTDEAGNTLSIIFEKGGMKINEKMYKIKVDWQDKISLNVSNVDGNITVTIDGQQIYTNKKLLSKIKFIDLILYNSPVCGSYGSGTVCPHDKLRTLRLISND